MHTYNNLRKSGIYIYGLIIVLMLASALGGALLARAWSPALAPEAAAAPAPLAAQAEPAQTTRIQDAGAIGSSPAVTAPEGEISSAAYARWHAIEDTYRARYDAVQAFDSSITPDSYARWKALEDAYRKHYGLSGQ